MKYTIQELIEEIESSIGVGEDILQEKPNDKETEIVNRTLKIFLEKLQKVK